MTLLKDILNERNIEQEKEFKKMIPKVEGVLKKHSGALTGKEKKALNTYLKHITGDRKHAVIDRSTADEAKTIVKYLSRV